MMRGGLMRASLGQLQSALAHYLRRFGAGRGDAGLVIDADRTLAPEDTGRLVGANLGLNDRIRVVFGAYGYEDRAFALVSEVWGVIPPETYLSAVANVAARIDIRPTWARILNATSNDVPIVVVSAGIPQVWRMVLARLGFGEIPVLGGCHPALDAYLSCSGTKAEVVAILQRAGWRVVAAGDSPIDLPMLQQADVPIFVPDSKGSPNLRRLLSQVPGVRQLIVDGQRFDGIATCSSDDLLAVLTRNGVRPC
jgi:phosphoserine phosphatase